MPEIDVSADLLAQFAGREIDLKHHELRKFPGEQWVIAYVDPSDLEEAQLASQQVEAELLKANPSVEGRLMLVIRAYEGDVSDDQPDAGPFKGLRDRRIDRLVQLLEARAKTSDALPSLNYIEDPRVSLSAIVASRHHLVYGRRGVGKTALLLEAKRAASARGDISAWINCHALRDLSPDDAFLEIAGIVLRTVGQTVPAESSLGKQLQKLAADIPAQVGKSTAKVIPKMNDLLKRALSTGSGRLFIFLDDYYLLAQDSQPVLLDRLHAMARDADVWLKIASIKNLTRPFDPSGRRGLETPQDASEIDLDITLEDPLAAQTFLESILQSYTSSVGLTSPQRIAKKEALGRLVLASGGVPRDYLTLFATSILETRRSAGVRKSVGKEDVARAAGRNAEAKERDLQQDVTSLDAGLVLDAIAQLRTIVIEDAHYTYFRVDADSQMTQGGRIFQKLVDLRFAHLINASLSDQHEPGRRFEAYTLDLSQFTKERLRRGLEMLDLENGRWGHRITGTSGQLKLLNRARLRDVLRRSPFVSVQPMGE